MSSNKYDVSIVTPHYEDMSGLRLLGESIQSSFQHLCFEWIVVDDGSSEAVVIAELARDLDFEVKVVYQDQNRGANECRRIGASTASGFWILFVDSDDLLLPAIETLIIDYSLYSFVRFATNDCIRGRLIRCRRPSRNPLGAAYHSWNVLIRRELFVAAAVWPDLRHFEDWAVLESVRGSISKKNQIIVRLPCKVYTIRPGGLSRLRPAELDFKRTVEYYLNSEYGLTFKTAVLFRHMLFGVRYGLRTPKSCLPAHLGLSKKIYSYLLLCVAKMSNYLVPAIEKRQEWFWRR